MLKCQGLLSFSPLFSNTYSNNTLNYCTHTHTHLLWKSPSFSAEFIKFLIQRKQFERTPFATTEQKSNYHSIQTQQRQKAETETVTQRNKKERSKLTEHCASAWNRSHVPSLPFAFFILISSLQWQVELVKENPIHLIQMYMFFLTKNKQKKLIVMMQFIYSTQ